MVSQYTEIDGISFNGNGTAEVYILASIVDEA